MEETRDSGMIGDGIHFERIRRVTGYLTGDLSTWNDAKRAEERDRVRHGVGEE
jgi:ribonucleoside-triphosphate reductase|nr:MAG TPA: anaerobic ribonucleoside triphosphate reductase [Caudoviricetes sp.]